MTELPAERNGMTREHSDRLHEMAEDFGGFSVTAYDIGGCPKGVWIPHHYRDDETHSCRCDELPDALTAYAAMLVAWAKDPAKLRHERIAAERLVVYCGGELE